MTFKLLKHGFELWPECDEDEEFIENELGLKEEGQSIRLVRKDIQYPRGFTWETRLSCLAAE